MWRSFRVKGFHSRGSMTNVCFSMTSCGYFKSSAHKPIPICNMNTVRQRQRRFSLYTICCLIIASVSIIPLVQAASASAVLEDIVPTEKAKRPKLKELPKFPEVTSHVFLDVVIYEEEPIKGRIIIGLFGKMAPKTTDNFRSLCLCDKGNGKISKKPLCYKGSKFHRIIPNFGIQGGDTSGANGAGGESIYGGYYEDETFEVPHNKLYLLSSANKGPNTNGSQFFINTVKTSWLDHKNVVFGMVLSGFDIVDEIEAVGTNEGRPKVEVIIEEAGEVPPGEITNNIMGLF